MQVSLEESVKPSDPGLDQYPHPSTSAATPPKKRRRMLFQVVTKNEQTTSSLHKPVSVQSKDKPFLPTQLSELNSVFIAGLKVRSWLRENFAVHIYG